MKEGEFTTYPILSSGVMGVPISFMDKFNPEQFEIVWQACGNTRVNASKDVLQEVGNIKHPLDKGGCPVLNNKRLYTRFLIKLKYEN